MAVIHKRTVNYYGIEFYLTKLGNSWWVSCEFDKDGNLHLAHFDKWYEAVRFINNPAAMFQQIGLQNYRHIKYYTLYQKSA